MGRLTRVLGEVRSSRCAQYIRPGGSKSEPLRRDKFCRVRTAQMIEEPAAIVQPGIGHAIAGMQASERDARRQGAVPVMQRELVRRVAALDRSRLVQAFAQAQHRRGDRETFGFVGIEQRIGPAANDVLPASSPDCRHPARPC